MESSVPEFSWMTRRANIKRLQTEIFDLVIIGGGINGAGVARDAASRGMKVALVEAQDFAEGTSSRSSKLAHGGIRYLENLEFGLVHESLSERQTLFEIAPNLCRPLEFLIPIFSSSRVGMWKMGLGMWLYDLLSSLGSPGLHTHWGVEELIDQVPNLKQDKLKGGYSYYDGYMDDDRLVIETLRSAHRAQESAAICNFVKVEGLTFTGDRCTGVTCEDRVSGKSWSVKAKKVVSCLGPWTDLFAKSHLNHWRTCLRPTKGVHISFSKEKFSLSKAVVMAVEKRIIFVIPRDNYVLVGTTDTDFKGDPGAVSVEKEDIDYILNALRDYFPELKLSINDIIGRYAGVRPLVFDGAESEGKTSREHKIYQDSSGVVFLVGGKYTTYRKMAEETVDKVLDDFSLEDQALYGRSQTKEPLHRECSLENYRRTQAWTEGLSNSYGMNSEDVQKLIRRHGLLAFELLKEGRGQWSYWQCEAYYGANYTMCRGLSDFFKRRSDVFLSVRDRGESIVDEILGVFAQYLGWDQEECEKQRIEFKRA